MTSKFTKEMLSTRKFELYQQNAEVIQFLRNNPVIAAEQLLGVKLLDYQKYILQRTWSCQYSMWTLSRNAAKTFEGAVLIMLKQLLYENGEIYIIAPTGKQSKNLFQNIEKIATDSVSTIKGLKDIYLSELQKHQAQHSGFKHDPASFEATCMSGTPVRTLNGVIDNNRGARSSLIFFD